MKKMTSFEAFKKRNLKKPSFKAAYDALEPEFKLLEQFIAARSKARMTQEALAKKLNMQQPALARLERGGYTKTSVNKLSQIADALGYSLKISLKAKSPAVRKNLK